GNTGHGVFLNQRRGPVRNNWFINNTIYGNKGDGIYNKQTLAPVAKNNIIVGNGGAGIRGSFKLVSYNNVWNNAGGNYKCTTNEGNISTDPLFADPDKGDFHLKSKAGRWDAEIGKWIKDDIDSPCIDAGDPKDDFSKEPAPNGGRINMGAYGNTHHASKS
ncbi:MAG: right-handed parallel beta-helix repeat-containing protein, partial [Planctomycetes bacterium]|nr:right-handed parallel beta-helix repeat-containing protein [Planctomycetota bacterium]